MKKAAILIADGFEEIEALVPYDLLNRVGVLPMLVNTANKKSATGANNLIIETPIELRGFDFEAVDALIIPGGPGYSACRR